MPSITPPTETLKESAALQDPQSGGRFVRQAGGALEQIQETKPAEGRAKRDQATDSTKE